MEQKLDELSLHDLFSLEQIINSVCRKYENIAQMNRVSLNYQDRDQRIKAASLLSTYNAKRDEVLKEMEKRINQF